MKKQGIICGVLSATLFEISGILASILFRNQNINPEWLVGVRMSLSGIILLIVLFCFSGRRVFEIWLNKKRCCSNYFIRYRWCFVSTIQFLFICILW